MEREVTGSGPNDTVSPPGDDGSVMTPLSRWSDDCAVATSVAPDVKIDNWSEARDATPAPASELARADWLWPLAGLALLGALLAFVVDDYPLRTIIAGN